MNLLPGYALLWDLTTHSKCDADDWYFILQHASPCFNFFISRIIFRRSACEKSEKSLDCPRDPHYFLDISSKENKHLPQFCMCSFAIYMTQP